MKKMKAVRSNWKTRFITLFLPLIYKIYMELTYYTSRKRYINFEEILEQVDREEKNILCALWHQDIVISPYVYRKKTKKKIATVASKSKDGEIISCVLKKFGFAIIRGSSSRGGAEAIESIKGYFDNSKGSVVAITVDGPRGPARKVKPGFIRLAKETGATIYPLRGWARRKILLNNWDNTMIPLPLFNHLVFVCGEPITVPKNADKKTLQRIRGDLEFNLKEIAERAEREVV